MMLVSAADLPHHCARNEAELHHDVDTDIAAKKK
jgi:hypothetical protein